MPYPRGRHASWIVALLFAACSDAPTAPLSPPLEADADELDLLFPAFASDLLVTEEIETLEEPPDGPSLAIVAPGEENPLEQPDDHPDDAAGIFDERTFVYFNADHVFAQGEHRYIGNKSRIETTAKAYFDGQLIGTQLGVKEESSIFLLSGFYMQYMQAVARIYTDHTCGLAADASSFHSAWWEAVMGSPVSTFYKVERTSQSTRLHQKECTTAVPKPGDGGGGSGGMCWVEVWYDEATGEILDWNPLYCESAGGG